MIALALTVVPPPADEDRDARKPCPETLAEMARLVQAPRSQRGDQEKVRLLLVGKRHDLARERVGGDALERALSRSQRLTEHGEGDLVGIVPRRASKHLGHAGVESVR